MILTLPHRPSGDQWQYFKLPARHTVGVIGRQYGKSTLATLRAVKKLMNQKDGNHYWVSPVYSQAKVQFDRLVRDYRPFIEKPNKTELNVKLVSGSWIHFKGSDKPENLKSDTLTSATLDECGTMHEAVWSEVIRPMLAVKQGGCDFIGTPKGKNWFFLHWQNAATDPDYSRHHAPSDKSPFFSAAEFEKIRATTAEAVFRQEYLAEFVEDGSEVFRNFRECLKGQFAAPEPSRLYCLGVDIAKHVDWTVITAWDVERRHMVALERFNQVEWSLIEARIMEMARKYNNALVKLDATGVGDPVFDRLSQYGLRVSPVRITAPVKTHLVESLIMAIEKQEISFPHHPDIVQELSIFGATKTHTGHVKYSAPAGYHDDIVMSMALAVADLISHTPKPAFHRVR